MRAVALGAAALLHIPGEPFAEMGQSLRAAAPFEQLLILSNPCPEAGYLPTLQAHGEGGDEPQFAALDPRAESQIRAAALGLLDEMARYEANMAKKGWSTAPLLLGRLLRWAPGKSTARLAASALISLAYSGLPAPARAASIAVDTPVEAPTWALLQRQLLQAQTQAGVEFFQRYFDERGYLRCVLRWGGDDGPDDAIESLEGWPVLHALGAPDTVLQMYKKAWEGHLQQYTRARTSHVPFARQGMYYREFPVMFDWLHNAEGLKVFNLQGLSDPYDRAFQHRVTRYADFYTGADSTAPNYDPQQRLIRSMFNGSKGPLMRPATALDWAGDPIEIEGRFKPRHGERNYAEMLAHFEDYTDIVGDHPQNLGATTLAFNAYALTGRDRYRQWLLEYVDAWRQRTLANGGVIPTKIGLDGRIGGPQGKWYGGVYGWGFTVVVPQNGQLSNRNTHYMGLTGFANALLVTGDLSYTEVWSRMIDTINAQAREVDGQTLYPHMYGDEGWYAYGTSPYAHGALELYYWSMGEKDRRRLGAGGWLGFLEGRQPTYPESVLRSDLNRVAHRVEAMRQDPTTPDTRLSDDPMVYNPVWVGHLVQLMLGGPPPGAPLIGGPLHCRVRYFDPAGQRAGVPPDVAALVERLGPDSAAINLVNTHAEEVRLVVVQGGAYGEHRILAVTHQGTETPVQGTHFTVRLGPGAGGRLHLRMQRYAHRPTLTFPWDRSKSAGP